MLNYKIYEKKHSPLTLKELKKGCKICELAN